MAKIVLIGAGSHVFSKHLVTDILTYPELRDSTITLMDIAAEPLVLITDYARKIVAQNGFNTKIESTTNRQEALDGADYVLTTIKVGDWQPSSAEIGVRILRRGTGARRYAGGRGSVLRGAPCAGDSGDLPGYGKALPGRLADELYEPDGDNHLGGKRLHPRQKCRFMPQRPAYRDDSGEIPGNTGRRARILGGGHQPYGMVSGAEMERARCLSAIEGKV